MLFFGFIDPLYLVVFILTLLISVAAQIFIKSQYNKWGKVQNGSSLTGREVGYAIVNRTKLGGGNSASIDDSPEVQRLADLRRPFASVLNWHTCL